MPNYLYDIKSKSIQNIKSHMVFEKLYLQEVRIPTLDDTKNTSIDFFKNYEKAIKKIKKSISRLEYSVPLYDIVSENIYLIDRYQVKNKVVDESYRFPDRELLEEISDKQNILKKSNSSDPLQVRKLKKIQLMLEFINSFDLDILYDTYIRVYYKYSSDVGYETTTCIRPSYSKYMYHLKPYISRSEIISTAYNMGISLKRKPDTSYSVSEINNMCSLVQSNEFTNNMLVTHKNHIVGLDSIGLVQYYTLHGSFFINQYLRGITEYKEANEYLEQVIEPMWKLVLSSPAFDKKYILYRFIRNDDYLKDVEVGSEYVEKGFMSTTRDPYYRSDSYGFGYILIKIIMPANVMGVALSVETISYFPEEQEIIFPPKSKFKLITRDNNVIYHNKSFESKIKTKYEFEWVGNNPIIFDRKSRAILAKQINFIELVSKPTITLEEKIQEFVQNNVSDMNQFNIKIGDLDLVVRVEWYDSTTAYKNFYAIQTNHGFSIYTFYKKYILFFIEIAENQHVRQMHVNYHLKYSMCDKEKVVSDADMIKFIASISHYFNIQKVMLYATHTNCQKNMYQNVNLSVKQRNFETIKQTTTLPNMDEMLGGSYCVDIYQYIKNKTKKYSDNIGIELYPKFSYYEIDGLHNISPQTVLSKDDRDDVYQIYEKYYMIQKNVNSIADFYVWLVDNKCHLIDIFVSKIDKIFPDGSPFKNTMYLFDSHAYLYNRNIIQSYPTYMRIDK